MRNKITKLVWGSKNLKRYFGLPHNAYNTRVDEWNGSWLDHFYIAKVTLAKDIAYSSGIKHYHILVSEPYSVDQDDLEKILQMCKKYNLEVYFEGHSDHNPGGCFKITISNKKIVEDVLNRINTKI